jgi:hypothetical protein
MQVPVNLNDMPIQDEEISDPSTQLSHIQQKSDVIIPNEEDVATFATVINPQGVFFQAFLAATPKHLIMERALEYMLAYYEANLQDILPPCTLPKLARYSDMIPSRKHPQGIGIGPYTLAAAYSATSDDEWADLANILLTETHQLTGPTESTRKRK